MGKIKQWFKYKCTKCGYTSEYRFNPQNCIECGGTNTFVRIKVI